MDGLEHVEPERWLEAEAPAADVGYPVGCKGTACPFFAACQGGCATRRAGRQARRAAAVQAVATMAVAP